MMEGHRELNWKLGVRKHRWKAVITPESPWWKALALVLLVLTSEGIVTATYLASWWLQCLLLPRNWKVCAKIDWYQWIWHHNLRHPLSLLTPRIENVMCNLKASCERYTILWNILKMILILSRFIVFLILEWIFFYLSACHLDQDVLSLRDNQRRIFTTCVTAWNQRCQEEWIHCMTLPAICSLQELPLGRLWLFHTAFF